MSFPPDREKELPAIPVDIDANGTVVEDSGLGTIPSSKSATFADTNKSPQSVKVGNTLSEEETCRLHELWNEAGLSATKKRAHRRRRRDQHPTPRRIPAPISIPEPANVPLISLAPSADQSITSMTPPTMGTRRRWGLLSARPFSETREAERKAPNTLEKLRAMAQNRLKKKLKYAKSAPNLGDQATPLGQGVVFQPVAAMPTGDASKDEGTSGSRNLASPGKLATPESIQEAMDENAIYFTIDPNWRASQGSVQFEYLTPVPDSLTSLGRPDSPLLHRHHSLDQLSFAAQRVTKRSAANECSEMYPRDEVHPIDELHAYLEL